MDNTFLLPWQFMYYMLRIILLFTGLSIQTLLVKGLVGSLLSVQWLHCKGFFFSGELAMCKLSFLLFPSSCFPVSGNNLWFGNRNALVGFKELKACHTRSVHWIYLSALLFPAMTNTWYFRRQHNFIVAIGHFSFWQSSFSEWVRSC